MLRELLAQNIARAFAEKPISKKELSEKIGVHPNIVGRWVSAGWNSGICARRMSGLSTRRSP